MKNKNFFFRSFKSTAELLQRKDFCYMMLSTLRIPACHFGDLISLSKPFCPAIRTKNDSAYRYTIRQRWSRSGFSGPDPNGKFQNLHRSTGVFTKGFCSLVHCSMHLMKNFQKRGMGEVLTFATPDEDFRKKRKKMFAFFAKITQF